MRGSIKMDILTGLEDAGVDWLVFRVLIMLEPKDVCSVLQVCQSWSTWDCPSLWRGLLAVEHSSGRWSREEEEERDIGLKERTKRLWKLRKAWRRADCTTKSFQVESSVLSILAGNTTIYVGLNSGDVEEWSMSGCRKRSQEMHEKGVTVLRYRDDKGRIITGSYDGWVRQWNSGWEQESCINFGVAVSDLIFIHSEDSMLICGDLGRVQCWRETEGTWNRNWNTEGGEMINCLVMWGDSVVTGDDNGELVRRCPQRGQALSSTSEHQCGCSISSLASSPLGLWSASFDCSIRLWSLGEEDAWVCKGVLTGHTNPIRCLDLDSARLVSGDYRGFLMIWDLEDIREELEMTRRKKREGKKERGEGIYFIRPGSRMVQQQGKGGQAEVLQHSSLLQHRGIVTSVLLSGGGTLLISGSRDRTVNIHQFSSSGRRPRLERKSYL